MNQLLRTARILVASMVIISCSDDDPASLEDVSENIEAEISPFIESFVEEAAIRGASFDFKGFEATFSLEDIDDNELICGRASGFSESNNSITIRRSDLCWIQQSDTRREALVFHEMGHALLDRPHRDDLFDNGLVKSVMETGTLGPYNQFTPLLKTYLFDELFDETTEQPPWVSGKTEEVIVEINSGLEDSDEGWSFITTQNLLNRSAVTGVRTSQAAASGDFSLGLQTTQEFDETLFWRFRTDELNDIPETAEVIIEVKFRMQNVEGGGVAIAGGLDKNNEVLSFTSTENNEIFTGTGVFQTHTLIIPYFPNTSAFVSIILAFLPNTTGLVFFDDITIRAMYNPAFGPV